MVAACEVRPTCMILPLCLDLSPLLGVVRILDGCLQQVKDDVVMRVRLAMAACIHGDIVLCLSRVLSTPAFISDGFLHKDICHTLLSFIIYCHPLSLQLTMEELVPLSLAFDQDRVTPNVLPKIKDGRVNGPLALKVVWVWGVWGVWAVWAVWRALYTCVVLVCLALTSPYSIRL
jgi:hypothetical protein